MRWIVFLLLFPSVTRAYDLDLLRQKAVAVFEKEIGPTEGVIDVELNPESCLRTGYQRSTKTVVFCQSAKVKNAGLESLDVINHEFFHALFCGKFPKLCQMPENDFLHEALADAFAYRLHPDRYFGENFYVEKDFVREYLTDWLPELLRSEHEKGSALASRIIRAGKPLSESLELFEKGIESLVSVEVSGLPASSLNRYRFEDEDVLELEFQFNFAVPVVDIEWQAPPGVMIETFGLKARVQVTNTYAGGKSFVNFVDANGKRIGRWTFYFAREIPRHLGRGSFTSASRTASFPAR